MSDYTQQQLDKAVSNYAKRLEYNKTWRANNVEKCKAMRQAYNKKKWENEKLMLAAARDAGLL
jgi:hypothetical protein